MPELSRFTDDYLSTLLARASHIVSSEFHARVRAAGLSVADWRVLATLSDRNGLPVGELSRIVLFKQPTLTKLIDRMERKRLVERRAADADRRRTLIYVTDHGRTIVQPLLAAAKRHEAGLLAAIAPDEAVQLKALLRDLIDRSDTNGHGPR